MFWVDTVITWVVPLPRMPVTTRIVSCLVGNPNLNLHLPLLLGRGTTQGYYIKGGDLENGGQQFRTDSTLNFHLKKEEILIRIHGTKGIFIYVDGGFLWQISR